MKSLRGGPVYESKIPPPEPKKAEAEGQAIGLTILTACFGLPDISHMIEIGEHLDKVETSGSKRSVSRALDKRAAMDPRRALQPR